MNGEGRTVLYTCSIFEREVEELRSRRWPELELRKASSALHMRPPRLGQQLTAGVDLGLELGRAIVLVYGDCCAAMAALEGRDGVVRTDALNCPDLLLGRAAYRELSRQGCFFVFPEWAERWPHMFAAETGLGPADVRDLMQETHRKLLYLDTGLVPVPVAALRRCEEAAGLGSSVLAVSLDRLASSIEEALGRLRRTA